MKTFLQSQDPEIFKQVQNEEKREAESLELIPSENYASLAVREALGSVFTNKYSEGYPGARYYGGQEFTDAIETLAITRACDLFHAKFANVQPHSGAPANLAVYFALAEASDTILGMDLSHGGHLTHGHPVISAAKVFHFVHYKMKNIETGELDYDEIHALAKKETPKILLAGFSAYTRNLDYKKLADIAHEVGAVAVADMAHMAGLIAGGVARNPLDDGFDVMTATTHKTLRGPRGGLILVRDKEELFKKIQKAVFPGLQGGPHMNVIAAKAVAFAEAKTPAFQKYSQQVLTNAQAMAQVFLHHKIRLIGGGTENHMVLADVFGSLKVSGEHAQNLLDQAGITVNKNMIADDPRSPLDPSGIRFGTPAMTTRGMKEGEATQIAEWMVEILQKKDEFLVTSIHKEVQSLCQKFPIPESY